MGWTAEKVRALRESNPSETAKKDEESGKWTAERVRALRTSTPSQSAGADGAGTSQALRASSPGRGAKGTAAAEGTDLYSMALEDYRTRNNLGFADAMDSRSDELNRQKVTVSPAEKMEQNASTVQKLREQRNNGIRMDVYSTVNNWKDASERNRELARLVTEPTLPRGAVSAADLPAGVDYLAADTGGMGIMPVLENTRYMDSDLKKMGYTQDEINRARLYMKAYNDLSLGERAGRRVESDLEGNKENIKGMIGQYAGALSPALTASAEEQMIRRVQSGRYTNEQLEAAGYDPELIRTAHERIRSGELYDKADDDSNRLKGLYEWGRDAHKAGENLTADAMAGESNVGRFFHGAASSAAENLIVSAINPALVLPVLSAHGAGDSMAASDEAGESPEKAILKATAKFGAGWAINSVGVADLAKTMGSDYAKDTVAGTIADWVRRQVGNQAFREAYPAIANAISGGADNAMQAFVETYADKAIDAVMGDQEAAKTLFNKDTFLTALEAGLSGGASGALGGAVGTGLSRMNAGDSSLRGSVDEFSVLQKESRELEHQQNALKTERTNWLNSAEVKEIEAKRKSLGLFSAEAKEFKVSEEYQAYLAKRKDFNQRGAELENRIGEVNNALREAHAKLETQRNEQKQKQQAVYDAKAKEAGGAAKYRRQLAVEQFGTTSEFERAGYILPDGQMLDFARNDKTRDTDHREIMSVFGPAEVSEGTDALNKFLADGNVRVMAEAPGVDLAEDKAPTAAQLEQIREMVGSLGSEQRKFTLDISTADGRVAASKEYSGRIDADRVVREIRDYYKTGELPAESSLARFRYQLAAKAEQAERDARKNTQRQASRAIADNSAAMETLAQMMGVTHGVRISQDSIDGLAVRWTKANGSRADRTKIAGETRALVEYMTADGASMSKASALSETIADEILSGATYRNTELWDEYPEYHDLSYTVNKDGPAKAELVKRYGTWSEAVAEARRHGVKLRQAEGVRDGNPAEVYEAIVNDTRAMGGTKEGAAALFRGAAKAAGVDGAASMESTEWLDVLMNVHDAIKPRMMSRFADAAEYEDAKVELADRMLGDILNVPEMTDAQAIFDGFQRWQRQAVAAAVGEENAEQALKDLRKVQKEQNREFNRRMYENSRNQTVNRYAEENPGAGQRELKNVGDMNEFLTFNREEYERRLRAERQRLKMERQQMLDEITLEFAKRENELNIENDLLAHEYAKERARADYAERQLMVQDQEIADWEEENRRKAAQWEKLQKERDRKAEELWNDFADKVQEGAMSEIAKAAKANELAERRAKLARESRKKDELKRAIRNNATQLNQMALRPAKDKYVQPRLILRALEVAKLADMTLLNQNAVNRLDALANSIRAEYGDANHPVVTEMSNDWEQSGIANLIDALKADLSASKEAQLDQLRGQLAEAEALEDSQKVRKLRSRLEARIKDVENKPYLPMTANQLRVLKAITTSTLHVIRQANKTLSLQQAEAVDKIAGEAAVEVNRSKGNDGKFRRMLTRYNLDMLGGTRVFRMLGGYAKNSQMEKLGTMLNDGQRRQTEILVEGTHLFDNVTGKKNLKQMEQFAGKGAKLVDLGLKDNRGKAVPLTHAQMCSLYMHLRNADSKEHLMNGGFTVPDAVEYNKGNIVEAYQKGQTVRIGMLTDSEGKPMADTIVSAIEKNLTDYDRAWIGSMENFFGSYTTDLINETSMKLLGYKRAVVKNYYPIAVNKKALATQIEGLHLDATIEGRGFLKNRVKSPQPILLEECNNVVQRSLRDTAAYAGLAPAIRDVQKVLNSRIETEDGLKVLKNGILEEKWGSDAVNYVDELLTDLQTPGRKTRKSSMTALGKLRGNYAGAILTLNPGVAIAQAASLPTAGAVLGADTMAAVVPFVKNFSPKQRAALEAEIAEHGDALLQYRLRGTQRGELESIGKNLSAAEKGMEKVPKQLTGWINGVDEITVAALWEGSKRYVEHHAGEFGLTDENLSAASGDSSTNRGAKIEQNDAYWEAVNKTYQRVIEETQPNYTTMQRAGIQRSDNELVRTLTMFTTQRFQNYGILADAVMAYNAQRERSHADPTEENRAELKRAGKNLNRAVTSQIVQTAVFAAMKIGADFLLHRWDREQDENGDITAWSLLERYTDLYLGSAAGTFLYGSELYNFVGNVAGGRDYDVISAPNLSAVNDLGTEAMRLYKLLATDTGEMDEEELEAYHEKLRKASLALMEDGLELKGLPAGNAAKLLEAAWKWGGNAAYAVTGGKYGEKLSLNSLPASATGQYDRLYNAIRSGDSEEAAAALGKLEAMGKDEKTITSQLKNRLKKYSPEVEQAARARNEGNDRERQDVTKRLVRELYETLGIREGVKADAEKREAVIDLVTEAINQKADSLLAGDQDRTAYSDLTDALETGKRKDVQDEIDRLRTAGKADSQIKSKITDAVKEEYLAGNDHDREKLEKLLTSLTKEDGTAMYEEKNFAQWVKDAAKKEEQAKNSKDEWAGVR